MQLRSEVRVGLSRRRAREMAPGNEGDDRNDAASSEARTEEGTTARRQRLTTSTGTLTSPSGDSLHAQLLPSLPFELVVEILCRLPVKSLLQFRCVCKSWNSLISDPKFARKHLLTCHRHHLIVSSTNSSEHLQQGRRGRLLRSTEVDVPCARDGKKFLLWESPIPSVVGATSATPQTQLRYPLTLKIGHTALAACSCDGIFCFPIDQRCALLWNPSIRKFKISPPLEIPTPKYDMRYVRTFYSFGYDHFTDNYKIVAVFCCGSYDVRNENQVRVHTLGTDSWRRIPDFPYGVLCDRSGKFVSGTVNWLIYTASRSSHVIVSLDLGKESYQELSQPDYGAVDVFTLTLGVLRDCLCIFTLSDSFISDVWVMKDYGNKDSWTKLFSVPYTRGQGYSLYCNVLHIYEDDQVLLDSASGLVIYNSRNGTFKIPKIQNINRWMIPEVYVESLISPCS